MEQDRDMNARINAGMTDARTHVNREKGRDGIEPPRSVREQLGELVATDEEGVRRRDPLGAARAQQTRRDNGVGGAWIATSQAANEQADDIVFEKIPNPGHTRRREGSDG